MLTYSTEQLPAKAKVSYWNDVISDVFTPLETRPINSDDYDAEARCVPLGPLWLSNVVAGPETVTHSATHTSRLGDRKFFLHLQLERRLLVTQCGKEALLEEGDSVLCDSSQPYTLHHPERCSTLVLAIPFNELKLFLPTPEQVIAIKLPGNQGFSQTLSVMLKSLWAQADDDAYRPLGHRIARNLLDILATTWMSSGRANVAETAASVSRRVQIARHIEASLRDPDLTTRSVAAAFGISTRYLHMLFSTQEETVSHYILRRRLEQCVKQFADPLWAKRTITEIAFGWGFNNATHFARVFRNAYGMSPRDYRNSRLSPPQVLPSMARVSRSGL